MKNIHVLPTDKPSRFYFNNNDKCFQLCKVDKKSTPLKINQNIYITDDSEIKEGDWCLDIFLQAIFQANSFMGIKTKNTARKIILTTDQDLIEDYGVQSIDDDFLEWFVKNPSCEFVEVYKHKGINFKKMGIPYKIMLPKEEPKKLYDLPLAINNVTISCDSKPEQEEQNKKMYSEEEVEEIFKQAQLCAVKADGVYFKYETFEKLKNK